MKTLINKLTVNQQWLLKWVFMPVGAYYLSWVIGLLYFMLPVYAIVIVLVQKWQIKALIGDKDIGLWYTMWPLYVLFAFLLTMICPILYPAEASMAWIVGILAFYASQSAGEVILAMNSSIWRWGWFTMANLIAAAVWIGGGYLFVRMGLGQLNSEYWFWFYLPMLGLLSNTITGLGLLQATKAQPED